MNWHTERDGSGSSALAAASMILGLASIALFMTGLSLFVGALAVIFALLSRGSGPLRSRAAAGIITGIIGIVLEVLIIAANLLLMSSGGLEQYQEQLQEIYREYDSGISGTPPALSEEAEAAADSLADTEWTYYLANQECLL